MTSDGQIFSQQEMSVAIKTDDIGMLGEIQGGFRRGRRTEDNLFMLEKLIEMVKGRKNEIFVAIKDMEKVI